MENRHDIGKRIIVLSNQLKRSLDSAAVDSGITGMQAQILGIISEAMENNVDIFQKDVEENMQIRRSSVSGLLQLMEKRGLIYRESVSYDARLKKINLTKESMKLELKLHENICNFEETLIKGIDPKDLETFTNVLELLSKNVT